MNIFDIDCSSNVYASASVFRVPLLCIKNSYFLSNRDTFLIQFKHTCTSYNIEILLLILYVYIKSLNHTFYAHNAMKDGVFGFVLL